MYPVEKLGADTVAHHALNPDFPLNSRTACRPELDAHVLAAGKGPAVLARNIKADAAHGHIGKVNRAVPAVGKKEQGFTAV